MASSLDGAGEGQIFHHLASQGPVPTNLRIGGGLEQHEGPRRKRHRRCRVVGFEDGKAEAQQAGHDRLHHPFRQASATQPRRQAQQIGLLIKGLSQGPFQGIGLEPNIGIDEQQPLAGDLVNGPAAGPVLAHPAFVDGPGAGLDQPEVGRCRASPEGVVHRCIAGLVIHHQHRPVPAGGLIGQNAGDTGLDVVGLVEGGDHHGQRRVRSSNVLARLQARCH